MRLIDADKYMNHLRAEINSEADIIAKYIKEDDPIGTVKDCGRIGRLQGLQWNRNMLELDCFTVEAIPKADYEAKLKDIQAEIRRFMYDVNPGSSESDYACNYMIDIIQQKINELKGVEDGKDN